MTFFPLGPMPSMKRPSLISSMVAAVMAMSPGERL